MFCMNTFSPLPFSGSARGPVCAVAGERPWPDTASQMLVSRWCYAISGCICVPAGGPASLGIGH